MSLRWQHRLFQTLVPLMITTRNYPQIRHLVKIPESRVRLKHALGPHREEPHQKGKKNGFTLTPSPGKYSTPPRERLRAYGFSNGKREPKGDIQLPQCCKTLSRRLTWVSSHGINELSIGFNDWGSDSNQNSDLSRLHSCLQLHLSRYPSQWLCLSLELS